MRNDFEHELERQGSDWHSERGECEVDLCVRRRERFRKRSARERGRETRLEMKRKEGSGKNDATRMEDPVGVSYQKERFNVLEWLT